MARSFCVQDFLITEKCSIVTPFTGSKSGSKAPLRLSFISNEKYTLSFVPHPDDSILRLSLINWKLITNLNLPVFGGQMMTKEIISRQFDCFLRCNQ